MISVNQAKRLILKNVSRLETERLPLGKTDRLVLAEDVYALDDVPLFTNSAMDGYAVKSSQTKGASERNPLTLR